MGTKRQKWSIGQNLVVSQQNRRKVAFISATFHLERFQGAAKSTTAQEGEAPDEFPLVAGEEEKATTCQYTCLKTMKLFSLSCTKRVMSVTAIIIQSKTKCGGQ